MSEKWVNKLVNEIKRRAEYAEKGIGYDYIEEDIIIDKKEITSLILSYATPIEAQNKILTKALKRIMRIYAGQFQDVIDLSYVIADIRKIARDAIKEVEKVKDEKG